MGRKRKSDKNKMFGTTLSPNIADEVIEIVDKYYGGSISKFIREATIEKKNKYKRKL